MVKAVARVLLKLLNLLDPDKRDEVSKRRALDWGEKYILTNEEIKRIEMVKPFTEVERKQIDRLERKLERYKKWFFDYN